MRAKRKTAKTASAAKTALKRGLAKKKPIPAKLPPASSLETPANPEPTKTEKKPSKAKKSSRPENWNANGMKWTNPETGFSYWLRKGDTPFDEKTVRERMESFANLFDAAAEHRKAEEAARLAQKVG